MMPRAPRCAGGVGRALTHLGLATLLACGGGGDGPPIDGGSPDGTLDLSVSELVDPPARFGPWVRWWWPGNDVDASELASLSLPVTAVPAVDAAVPAVPPLALDPSSSPPQPTATHPSSRHRRDHDKPCMGRC